MSLDRLWAGWRTTYIQSTVDGSQSTEPDADGLTLFERILRSGLPDDQTHILWRGQRCFALLNAFPYSSGHLMVLPQRAVVGLSDLEAYESAELWAGVNQAVAAITAAYRPDGINVGLNLGRAAGAGVPDHLHVHCLPRWAGDTNFTTTVAETRVLPEPLDESWRKLVEVWPEA